MANIGPPPVLDCARVIAYAIVDASVVYSERGCFFVGGKLLGPVTRLAICQNLLYETEIFILHCDNEWHSFGAQGRYATVDEAKEAIEKSYHGLKDKWVDTFVTEEEARDFLDKEFADEKCSFCGRWPIRVEQMIGDEVRICNHCVDRFYELIHKPEK